MAGNLTSAQYLRLLKQWEDTAGVFRKCAQARGKCKQSGFTSIEVPADPTVHPKQATEWRTVDCPQEIESLLLKRCRSHFGQAQGTPMTVPPPLSQEINFEASPDIS